MLLPSLEELRELDKLIWGCTTQGSDVFSRWCQGFQFSPLEPSAMIQTSGGPCAIIASVQAVIIRNLLFSDKTPADVTAVDSLELLISALKEILILVSKHNPQSRLYWAHFSGESRSEAITDHLNSQPTELETIDHTEDQAASLNEPTMDKFKEGLRFSMTNSPDELHGLILSSSSQLQSQYAILCFLYSVLLTHGLTNVERAMSEDATDSLIDPVFGHSSQLLFNLLITGQSTPHLFDGVRTVAGFTLGGIMEQPKTGFLTLFESLSYCESGWYLKNPSFPVWILGSETHFTVLASPEPDLVFVERAGDSTVASLHQAELEFSRLSTDQDTNSGFVSSDRMGELLTNLDIPHSQQTLEELKRVLDPEDLGIILEEPFLRHFYPTEMARRRCAIRNFRLLHYNGLVKPNRTEEVRYITGEASILDPTDELADTRPVDSSPMQRCLQTKWPTIRVQWPDGKTPSLD